MIKQYFISFLFFFLNHSPIARCLAVFIWYGVFWGFFGFFLLFFCTATNTFLHLRLIFLKPDS